MQQIISKNQSETEKIGQDFASRYLSRGGVILLNGPLGAGKTAFVRGFAKGLGIKTPITSPTFVFLKIYSRLYHLDLYRLDSPEQFEMLGVTEYLENDGDKIFLIEWPENANLDLNSIKNSVKIIFKKNDPNANKRTITIQPQDAVKI